MIATIALLASLSTAPIAGLDVEASPREITVGDRAVITLTLAARSPDSLVRPPLFPNWEETWGDARIVSVSPPERIGQGEPARFRQTLEVTLFQTGTFELPPPRVLLETTSGPVEIAADSGPVLRVVSVLPAGEEEPAPMPAEPPRQLPFGNVFWWTIGLLAVVCLVAGWLAARALPAAMRTRMVPPRETLEAQLSALANEEDAERLHTGISLALRRYLGGRLQIPAAEGTTSEIRLWLRKLGLPPEVVKTVSDLLQRCDEIKFAKVAAPPEKGRERLQATGRVGDVIEEVLTPEEEDDDAEEVAA